MTVDHRADDDRSAAQHIRRLWRGQGTTSPAPRRGPRQRLDLDDVLARAVAIADAEGLPGLSMRVLAADVGVTAMTLYSYVGSKDDLVSLIQDTALGPVQPDGEDTDVTAAVQQWAHRLYERYTAHPWLCEINWAESASGPHERDWLEALARILERHAVAPQHRAALVTAVHSLVRACAQTAAAQADPHVQQRWCARARATGELLGDLSARYPSTAGLQPIGRFEDAPALSLAHGISLLLAGARTTAP